MSTDRLETLAYPSFLDIDPSLPRHGDFSVLSPSARTSFTRVDTTAYNEEGAVDSGLEGHDDYHTEDGEPEAEAEPPVPQPPQVALTFLLVSGRRRNMTFESETTVGRVKELTWNAWPNGTLRRGDALAAVLVGSRRPHLYSCPANSIIISTTHICLAEWQDERPPAPSYLRILYLGKILQDEDTLESK